MSNVLYHHFIFFHLWMLQAEITRTNGKVLCSVWSWRCQYLMKTKWPIIFIYSFSLQSIVAKYSSQFRGNSQHDALEFLLWLLDRVHEDAKANPNNNSTSSSSIRKTKANAKVSPRHWFVSLLLPWRLNAGVASLSWCLDTTLVWHLT